MPSPGVAVALVAVLVSVIAALAFWSARRRARAASPGREESAWDRHARARSSSFPAEPPPSVKQKAPASKRGEAIEAKPASRRGEAIEAKPASRRGEAIEAKPASKRGGAIEAKPASKRGGAIEAKPASKRGGAIEAKPASKRGEAIEPKPASKRNGAIEAKPASKRGGNLVEATPASKRSPGKPAPSAAKPAPAPAKPAAPAAKPAAPAAKPAAAAKAPSARQQDDDDGDDLTIVTVGPLKLGRRASMMDDDDDANPTAAVPIVYDAEAAVDEPTHLESLILVAAAGKSDRGQRRRNNEDSYAILDSHGLFVVADGMGGHSGGEVASKVAVDTIIEAFKNNHFPGELPPGVHRRGGELAHAIQQANSAVFELARVDQHLAGMGTTVVSARFSPNKQRAYIGHVGDSRCYRLRNQELRQVTTDHTMGAAGLTGPLADRLERAVGIAPNVKVDLILARPLPDDLYLLCSDGLSKMVPTAEMRDILVAEKNLEKAAAKLVERANASGGKDNITVILVQVMSPTALVEQIMSR